MFSRTLLLEAGVLFLGEDASQRLFQIAVEVTQRVLLPQRHQLVRPVEEGHKRRRTGPEERTVRADLKADVHIRQPFGLGRSDVHITVTAGAVETVEQQLAAERPGDGGVSGQVEGHPDRVRITDLVPELHRNTEGELLGDEEAHHDLCLNRLAHRSTPQ